MNITRSKSNKFLRLSFLIILGAILFSNTFSPQFLIWLAPFVAFLGGWEAGLLATASALTWVYFRNWDDLIQLQSMVTHLLLIRNLILIILFGAGLRKFIVSLKK